MSSPLAAAGPRGVAVTAFVVVLALFLGSCCRGPDPAAPPIDLGFITAVVSAILAPSGRTSTSCRDHPLGMLRPAWACPWNTLKPIDSLTHRGRICVRAS